LFDDVAHQTLSWIRTVSAATRHSNRTFAHAVTLHASDLTIIYELIVCQSGVPRVGRLLATAGEQA